MATVKFRAEASIDIEQIRHLVQLVPELHGKFLGYVGKKARIMLKENYLSGQEIELRKYPKDKIGGKSIPVLKKKQKKK